MCIAHRGISRFRVRCGACHRAAPCADPLASPQNGGVGLLRRLPPPSRPNMPSPWPRKGPRVYDPGMTIYSRLVRPLAFRLDPETAHHLAMAAGARLGWAAGALRAAAHVSDDRLATDVAGLHFPTPIGLAAGFDKSGSAIHALAGKRPRAIAGARRREACCRCGRRRCGLARPVTLIPPLQGDK